MRLQLCWGRGGGWSQTAGDGDSGGGHQQLETYSWHCVVMVTGTVQQCLFELFISNLEWTNDQ